MFRLILILAGIAILVNSCSSADKITQLGGQDWIVTTLLGNTLNANDLEKGLPSLNFSEDGKLFGSTGCNSFTGSYKIDGTKLSLNPGSMTKMFCPGDTEQNFLRAINQVTNLKMEGSSLNLLDGTNTVMSLVPKTK